MTIGNLLRRMILHIVGFAMLAVAIVTSGCGGDDRPALGMVHGQVTLDGKPLDNAAVSFKPAGPFRESSANTDADGNYELIYIRDIKGAAIGKHKVYFSTANPIHKYVEKVPAKYNSQTTLEKEVKSGENEINFDLKTK